ncbi:MAG: hypothetical protein ACR2HJ_08965 [Fimbriimonadales bacterium]
MSERALKLQTMLLQSRTLREEYAKDTALFCESRGLGRLPNLDIEELGRQGDALIAKRYHELGKLAPMTLRSLGPRSADCFAAFAEQSWPTGVRRHLDDACEFSDYLRSIGLRVNAVESSLLAFRRRSKRIALAIPAMLSVQVMWRTSKRVRCRLFRIGRADWR